MTVMGRNEVNRRQVLLATALVAGPLLARGSSSLAQDATPVGESGGWNYTDVLGNTVTLPEAPTRIAADISVAAALHDFGIEAPILFGWSASNHRDGNHVAWGNVDPEAVEVVGDSDGQIELEALLAAQPDLIVSWIWDRDVPAEATVGIPEDLRDEAELIAPVVILNAGESNDIELARVEAFAAALGTDLEDPSLASAREAYEAKVAEIEQIIAEKPGLSVLFGSYGNDVIYIASPDYVGDPGLLRSLGLKIANDGSPNGNSYWETLSMEQALYFPSDVLYIDQYGPWTTLGELQEHPTIGQHPAVKAGQAGPWHRDLPLNYTGQAAFLESMLEVLRTAEKIT